MSAVAHAAPQAAVHPEPPRAADGVRPRAGGTTIKTPLRLVVGAQYADVALSTYVKVAALALRPEGCRAKVSVIASYLGTSKSSVERGLRPLINPDPVDGLIEIPTVRKTASGGTGESAHRVTRPLAEGELWVRIPVRASEALRPRLLRLYALIAYAVARGIPVTVAELGEMLYHHSGKAKGEHLSEASARRLVRQLEATGWITVHDREGHQGRHAYEAHRHPLHTVPETATTTTVVEPATDEQLALWGDGSPLIHDGSGPSDHDGSLATEEDLETDRRERTELGGGIRRRRPTATSARDNDVDPVDTFGRRAGLHLTRSAWQTVWQVLDPVRPDLAALSAWEWERVVTDVLRLLADDTPERLHDRLQRRTAMRPTDSLDTGGWRSFAHWLIGAGLVRRGCEDPDCETGTRWSTQTDCPICIHRRDTTTAKAQQQAPDAATDRRLAARHHQHQAQTTDDGAGDQEQPRPATSPANRQPPPPPDEPPPAPDTPARVGPPPGAGGWRALVAQERPHDTAVVFRDRWKGDHAHHLPRPETA